MMLHTGDVILVVAKPFLKKIRDQKAIFFINHVDYNHVANNATRKLVPKRTRYRRFYSTMAV